MNDRDTEIATLLRQRAETLREAVHFGQPPVVDDAKVNLAAARELPILGIIWQKPHPP